MNLFSLVSVVACVVFAVFVVVSAGAPAPLVVEHSLNGGASWIERGTVDPQSLEFTLSEANGVWTVEQLATLRKLALLRGASGGSKTSVVETSVLVRIRSSDDERAVHSSIAVNPCSLIVPRQYTSALTYIAERYGVTVGFAKDGTQQKAAAAAADGAKKPKRTLRINSMKLLNPFHDEVCEPTVFKSSKDVKLKISFVRSAPARGVGLPFQPAHGGADAANVHDGARRAPPTEAQQKAAAAAEGENKSFWEKYGTYIMIFVGVQLLSGFFGPKQGAGGGGEGGEGEGGGDGK